MTYRALALACYLLAGTAGLAPKVVAQHVGSDALPLDLAFSRNQLRGEDKPAVSHDGKLLAYEVYTPPVHSPGSNSESQPRFLPNGTPAEVVGLHLNLTTAEGGTPQVLCKGAANCWRPSWSPDDRRLAYYCDADGVPQLWVYDVTAKQSHRVSDTRIKAKLWWMDKPVWSPDGHEIFVPINTDPVAKAAAAQSGVRNQNDGGPTVTFYESGKDDKKNQQGPDSTAIQEILISENNATLGAIDVTSGKMRIIVPANSEPRPSSLKLSADGRWLSYLSVFMPKGVGSAEFVYDLAIVSAKGGNRIVVDTDVDATDRDYYDEPYLWSPDSKRIVYTKGHRLWTVEISTNGPTKPHLLNAQLGELNDFPFVLTRNGNAILVGLKEEKIYYKVSSKTLALVPFDGSQPKLLKVEGEPLTANSSTLWQSDSDAIYLLAADTKTSEQSILRVDLNSAGQKVVWKKRGRLVVAGGNSAGNSVLARFENLSTPPDYYRLSDEFSRMDKITSVEPRLESVAVGTMETFETAVPRFDGQLTKVTSAVFLPPHARAGDHLPTIVYFYAGSALSESAQVYGGGAPNSIPVQIFTTRGYAVLLVDVPMSPMGSVANPIQEMVEAILPQVYRAAELGYTDIKRVAIMGQSYGGYGTVAMITQTNLFRAAVAMDGMYDLAGGYAHMEPNGMTYGIIWSEGGQGRMGTHPWGDLRRYLANSPYYLADRIHTPLLLVHGEGDTTCPVEEARRMFNALKRLDKRAQLATYAGEGHVPGNWSLVNSQDAAERMLRFLNTYMK